MGLTLALALASSTAFGAARPDLQVTMLIDPPSVLPSGAEFSTAAVVTNAGASRSSDSRTRFYLSKDTRHSTSDLVLATLPTRRLAPEAESLRAVRIGLPEATRSGEYFLLACADSRRRVRERNERNNCFASAYPLVVTVGAPE